MASIKALPPSSQPSHILSPIPRSSLQSPKIHLRTSTASPSPLSFAASCSQSFLPVFRRSISLLRPKKSQNSPIRCSISQIHDYGTVDYERRPPLHWSSLYRRISLMDDPSLGAASVLNRWNEEGRKLTKWEICRVVKELRKFRRHRHALEVYEWMTDQGERFKLNSSDTAIQLDLISKVHGIPRTEEYFSKLPEASKDVRTYGALLNAYVQANMKEMAEITFEKMRNDGFAYQALTYNVMMTLYMNIKEFEKVHLIISEMQENNIALDLYSYNIWITTCAEKGDPKEMEQIVERMKLDESINPNWTTYSTLASKYIKLGHFEKAELCLKDVELRITGRDRTPYNYLISLYSNIGKKEDVYRIWNYFKSIFPSTQNLSYRIMISSLIRLRDIEGAEAIFEEWLSGKSSYDPRIGNVLMGWYIREGSLEKAERIFDGIREVNGKPNPNTWEIFAEGYMAREEISKALSCIKEAASIKRAETWRPKPENVAALMELCRKKADPVSAEALIEILKKLKCLDSYKSQIGSHVGDDKKTYNSDSSLERDESDQEDDEMETSHPTPHKL